MKRKNLIIITLLCSIPVIIMLAGCFPADSRLQKNTLFIGIDVSGSFYNSRLFDNAVQFTAFYIYSHLNGLGELKEPRALFVGSIGGDAADEPKSFHPIHDFKDKSVSEIERDLRKWFPQSNKLTDFNVLFEKIALTAKKNNLTLSPIEIVLVTDGVPDIANKKITSEKQRYANLKLKPLEYLARSVTIRVLYPNAVVANYWERLIKRRRVKMWTVEKDVMLGWKNQYIQTAPPAKQEKLLIWIKDNIDFFVRIKRFS